MAWAFCGRSPRGPSEKAGEVVNFVFVVDELLRQTVNIGVSTEIVQVVFLRFFECRDLVRGPLQHTSLFVEPVGAEFLDDGFIFR